MGPRDRRSGEQMSWMDLMRNTRTELTCLDKSRQKGEGDRRGEKGTAGWEDGAKASLTAVRAFGGGKSCLI